MQTGDLSLVHMVRRPDGPGAPPLLILLHGYGSNEEDLFSFAAYLDQRFLVVSVRGPVMLTPGAFAWFEIGFTSTGIVSDPHQVKLSCQALTGFIGEAVAAYGADPAHVYVAGFSQGGAMSALVTLANPQMIAGTVVMSGFVPEEAMAVVSAPEHLAGHPFLVTHGTVDTVVPIAYGHATCDRLARLNVDLTYHEYPMGHTVSMECLGDVIGWLAARPD